jgi:hypothetical protein
MSEIILQACKSGILSKSEIDLLIKNSVDANSKNKHQVTALMHAAIGNQKEIVNLLIRKGANVNAQCDRNQTALMYAAIKGYTEIVRLLIEKGAYLFERDYKGYTALHYAAGAGYIDTVKLLIEKGADKSYHTTNGKTAAQLAKENGYSEIYTLLSGKKEGCFIATAVYGSPYATEVVILKELRDNLLLNYQLGRDFVRLYYRISPPIANQIAKRKILKEITKSILIIPLIRFINILKRKEK